MAEQPVAVADLDDLVHTVADARAARWWVEAELSSLIPTSAVDAITLAVAELLNAACLPGRPAHLRVRVQANEVRVDVTCDADGDPELDDLARAVLAGTVDVWGLRVLDGHATFWARLSLL